MRRIGKSIPPVSASSTPSRSQPGKAAARRRVGDTLDDRGPDRCGPREGHHQQRGPRVGQRGDAASGTYSLTGVEVLEAADVEEEIEGAEPVHGQVADIADHVGCAFDALTSRLIDGPGGIVDSDDLPAAPDQLRGVLPAAAAQIEDPAERLGPFGLLSVEPLRQLRHPGLTRVLPRRIAHAVHRVVQPHLSMEAPWQAPRKIRRAPPASVPGPIVRGPRSNRGRRAPTRRHPRRLPARCGAGPPGDAVAANTRPGARLPRHAVRRCPWTGGLPAVQVAQPSRACGRVVETWIRLRLFTRRAEVPPITRASPGGLWPPNTAGPRGCAETATAQAPAEPVEGEPDLPLGTKQGAVSFAIQPTTSSRRGR